MKKILNSRGYSLLEVAVGTGIMIGLSIAGFAALSTFFDQQAKQGAASGLYGVRTEISKAFSSEEAFKNSMNLPENGTVFGCVRAKTSCTGAGGSFVLIGKNGKPVSGVGNPAVPSEGLDRNGKVCSASDGTTGGFNAVDGNDKCPYRYEVRWRPICAPGDTVCRDPTVELIATLSHKPSSTTRSIAVANPERYKVQYIRKESRDTLAEACLSLGGNFFPSLNECRLDPTGPCPPNQFVTGFDSMGAKKCVPMPTAQCPAGKVLIKANADGSFQCANGCATDFTTLEELMSYTCTDVAGTISCVATVSATSTGTGP